MLLELAAIVAPRFALKACAAGGRRVRARGRVLVIGSGTIVIGDEVSLDGRAAPIELRAHRGSTIVLGAGVRLEGGVSIDEYKDLTFGP